MKRFIAAAFLAVLGTSALAKTVQFDLVSPKGGGIVLRLYENGYLAQKTQLTGTLEYAYTPGNYETHVQELSFEFVPVLPGYFNRAYYYARIDVPEIDIKAYYDHRFFVSYNSADVPLPAGAILLPTALF